MKIFATFLVASLLVVGNINAQDTDYSFKEKYRMSLPAQLNVSSSDGNIKIVPSTDDQIEVFYIVKRNNNLLKINRAELEKELTLTVEHNGNTLAIAVKYREGYFKNNWNNQMSVNFEIHAPNQTATDLHTSDGHITVSGLTGEQRYKTSDGNIRISAITGNVTGRTSDGHFEMENIKGSVDIATSDGNIKLNNITGDVRSSTSDGNIDIARVSGSTWTKTSDGYITFTEISGSFSGSTSDGNIRGNLLQLKKELFASTGDGNIDITIPGKLGLDLDVRGESLHIPLDNFSGRSDEKSIQGKTNGGGIPVKLSTSDGNIRLTYQ